MSPSLHPAIVKKPKCIFNAMPNIFLLPVKSFFSIAVGIIEWALNG